LVAPGTYVVHVTVADNGSPNLTASTDVTIVVAQENARAYYTGAGLFWTSSISTTTATVTLSATVKDITAVTGDPAYDPYAGDIRNAKVTFINRDSATPDTAIGSTCTN